MGEHGFDSNNGVNEVTILECRTCLHIMSPDAVMFNIFERWTPPWDGMANTIAEDLEILAKVKVQQLDKHSKVICRTCYELLHSACTFTSIVKRSDQILQQRFPEEQEADKVWPKPIQLEKSFNSCMQEESMNVEIKEEVLSDNEYDDPNSVCENGEGFATLDIKVEPEEMIQQQPSEQFTVNGSLTVNTFGGADLTHLTNGSGEEMDKTKKTKEKKESCKKILVSSSSSETTPDPFDDGEFGSDSDYDTTEEDEDDSSCNVTHSQFELGKQRKKSLLRVNKSSYSDKSDSDPGSENSDSTTEYSSTESIFHFQKRKSSTSKQPKRKKSKQSLKYPSINVDCDRNSGANISVDSEKLRTNVEGLLGDTFQLNEIVDIEDSSGNPISHAQSRSPPSFADPDHAEGNSTIGVQPHLSPDPTLIAESLSLPPDPASAENCLTPNVQISSPSLDPSPNAQPPSTSLDPALCTQSPAVFCNQNSENENDTVEGNQRRPISLTPEPIHQWENTTTDIPTFEFDETSTGVQFDISPNMSPLDVFDKLFPLHILEYIVAKTNENGRSLCTTNRQASRNTRYIKYKDIDIDEMKKFLGLCLLMGQVNVPNKRKLFTYSDPLYFHPIFQYVMSARRFEQILRCLCVSELNSKGKEKIIKFIDFITENFRECYKPEKELSLDESLLLFRGRLSFKQYIKNKKSKYGIKFYELTTADGFVLNIIMYAGKDPDHERTKCKKTEKIVMNLMRPYLLKGYWLFMDNYYNSVSLSQKLVELKTHTTGTLRCNRKGNPAEITKKKLKKGEHVWARKNKVYVSKWIDKRPVLMITTLKHPKLTLVPNRHGQIREKPEEVAIYNKFMSGIDRSDQMLSYYSSPRKLLRWYKEVFFHLLDLIVWNSFYIYKRYCTNNDKRYDFLTFRESLIRSLIQLSPNIKPNMLLAQRNKNNNRLRQTSITLPTNNDESKNYTGYDHWPEKIPVIEGSKKTTHYLKCKICTGKKVRRETGLRCKGCPEKPALCALCFEEWHNRA